MCFEGIIIRKQAVKSELNNAAITQTVELQNEFFFWAKRLLQVCILQF